ncbi:small cell adhesion glycoprotein [Pteronotus mesoamericanus]|uniref:small cell adhesion glycoprotein n=1 Tax=Pteronotus mesoamericanus TaxID=1884717 RepID=UPI0023ED91C4|nr:small cell adhesion glycoprotein [Pteronotus parnellii mesoamericanus]
MICKRKGGPASRGNLQRAVSLLFSCPTHSAGPPTPTRRPLQLSLRVSPRLPAHGVPRWVCANLYGSRPSRVQKDALSGAGPSPAARPTGTETKSGQSSALGWSLLLRQLGHPRSAGSPPPADLLIPQGAHPLAAMTSFPTTPSPRELTTPIQRVTETLSPDAEASTALIAVVITVVFLTLLSVVVLIFFYLYKNKGSYVTYEPAEGEPSTILQMESDSAKGREKEEYFI